MPASRLLLLFVLALYLPLTLHSALKHGYFVDGMIYASVARNLAEGYGSFWHLKLSDHLFSVFHEHPPLGIWIQSLLYGAFGDTELIDKFYGFVIGFGILGTIAAIWRRVRGPGAGVWFPLLVFVLFPLTTYVLSYNWLEHILTLNIVLTALALIAALQADDATRRTLLAGGAGLLIVTGILIKGPTALYPLAIPLLWWAFMDRGRLAPAALVLSLALALAASAMALLLWLSDDAANFFRGYLQEQVLGSIQGRNSVHARTKLLESLLTEELISPLLVFAVAMFATRTRWRELRFDRTFGFFLAVALSGSLPLMISQKQNDYYLFISLPFYALALASLFDPLRTALEARAPRRRRGLTVAAGLLVLLAPTAMLAGSGQYRKDADYHKSFTETGIQLERRSRVTGCPRSFFFQDWNLTANFQRYHAATLTDTPNERYLVTTREAAAECVPTGYRRLSRKDTPLLLYVREDGRE